MFNKEPHRTVIIFVLMLLTPKVTTILLIELQNLTFRNTAGSFLWFVPPILGCLWANLLWWSRRDRIMLMIVSLPALVVWTGFSGLWHVCSRFGQCL
jgi:hypothetical protein